jgi:N-acetylmuramoyl-L-alanine amidase
MIKPRFIIVHYTAGSTFQGAKSSLTGKDTAYVSAHLLIGKNGELAQLVPFDTIAYHAGESAWGGRTRLNSCSIGLELVNPGWKRPTTPADWPTVKAHHANGGPAREWYVYPDAQITALNEVLDTLYDFYGSLGETLGHDQIAPGRKSDPGPAFPWGAVRRKK